LAKEELERLVNDLKIKILPESHLTVLLGRADAWRIPLVKMIDAGVGPLAQQESGADASPTAQSCSVVGPPI